MKKKPPTLTARMLDAELRLSRLEGFLKGFHEGITMRLDAIDTQLAYLQTQYQKLRDELEAINARGWLRDKSGDEPTHNESEVPRR